MLDNPYYVHSRPDNRLTYQDSLIVDNLKRQDYNSRNLEHNASVEAIITSRYSLALKNYLDLTTGFSEYLR